MINRRGFTLLIAIILSTVTLTVGLALLDIAYKHIVLATTAKASEVAFSIMISNRIFSTTLQVYQPQVLAYSVIHYR
jgi:hypothetical protein